jgi:hypothetical protein
MMDIRLLYGQENTGGSREVRVGSEEEPSPRDPSRITAVSATVYLVQRGLSGPQDRYQRWGAGDLSTTLTPG